MMVACAVLVLLAGLVVPRAVAILQSRHDQDTLDAIARLPQEVRNKAVALNEPVSLKVQSNTLVMEEDPPDQSPTTLKTVDLGTVQVGDVQQNGQQTNTGTWAWTAYPDGTAIRAGIGFNVGQMQKSLVLNADGTSQWQDGDVPDESQDQWTAGQLETRS
jgi:hypothetical protein